MPAAVLSNMMARAREEFSGDAASQYLINLPKPQIEALDEGLELIIRGWLHRNGLIPTFFKTEAIGEYPVPIPSQRQSLSDSRAASRRPGNRQRGLFHLN